MKKDENAFKKKGGIKGKKKRKEKIKKKGSIVTTESRLRKSDTP